MKKGEFCFLTDQYYIDFPDKYLMKNKETINGKSHDRPCFFSFTDSHNKEILWLVPISSQIDKYKSEYLKKISQRGFCDTIRFGELAGKEVAFLIQNICPASKKYIKNIYKDKNNVNINIDDRLTEDIIKCSKNVLSFYFKGNYKIIFPNVKDIKRELQNQLLIESIQKYGQAIDAGNNELIPQFNNLQMQYHNNQKKQEKVKETTKEKELELIR